jgi:hypothetical protein
MAEPGLSVSALVGLMLVLVFVLVGLGVLLVWLLGSLAKDTVWLVENFPGRKSRK